jgi:hypothetical protein
MQDVFTNVYFKLQQASNFCRPLSLRRRIELESGSSSVLTVVLPLTAMGKAIGLSSLLSDVTLYDPKTKKKELFSTGTPLKHFSSSFLTFKIHTELYHISKLFRL